MELTLLNTNGQSATISASDQLFAREYSEPLVHQLVVAFQANARQATRQQKDRSEVRHTTAKPWRQKGTGRARAGMSSSPLWRGGGRIFPNSPNENYSQKINKKMYRAGIATILSELVRQNRLVVVDNFVMDSPKTKAFVQKLNSFGLSQSLLFITAELDENLYLSSRNLPNLLVLEVQEANPVSLIRYPQIVITTAALAKMEEIWS